MSGEKPARPSSNVVDARDRFRKHTPESRLTDFIKEVQRMTEAIRKMRRELNDDRR